jgi:hypothetical protein
MHILRLSLAAIHAGIQPQKVGMGKRGRRVKELIPVIGIEFEDNICSTG